MKEVRQLRPSTILMNFKYQNVGWFRSYVREWQIRHPYLYRQWWHGQVRVYTPSKADAISQSAERAVGRLYKQEDLVLPLISIQRLDSQMAHQASSMHSFPPASVRSCVEIASKADKRLQIYDIWSFGRRMRVV